MKFSTILLVLAGLEASAGAKLNTLLGKVQGSINVETKYDLQTTSKNERYTQSLRYNSDGKCAGGENECITYYCKDDKGCKDIAAECGEFDEKLDERNADGNIVRCVAKSHITLPPINQPPITRPTIRLPTVTKPTITKPTITKPINTQTVRRHGATRTHYEEICIEQTAMTFEKIRLTCPAIVGINTYFIDYERNFNHTETRILNVNRHLVGLNYDLRWLAQRVRDDETSRRTKSEELDKASASLRARVTNRGVCTSYWVTVSKKLAQSLTDLRGLVCKIDDDKKLMNDLARHLERVSADLRAYKEKECSMLYYLVLKIDTTRRAHYEKLESCACREELLFQ